MWIGDFYYTLPTTLPELSVTSVYFVLFVLLSFILSRIFKSALRPYILLIANCIFVYSFGLTYLKTLIIITLITYLFGLILKAFRSKYFLAFSLVLLIGTLCYFKYAGFLLNKSIVAPLGLSFYTFKAISYLVDVYKEELEVELNPLYFADYLMFFPTITAGPINKAKNFLEEIRIHKQLEYKEYISGISLILFGIFEKMVVCDYIGNISSRILNNSEIVGTTVIFGIVLYSFQIYLDFDSYSNIAIGSARLFGFKIPKNFNSPYLAISLKDFWNRWHISLSTWLKDYIYIPLGGNRKGSIRKYINIIAVFVVSGLWHGSTWNFLIWGLCHGIIRSLEDYLTYKLRINELNKTIRMALNLFGVFLNFVIVTSLWLIFKYQTPGEVLAIISRCLAHTQFSLENVGMTIMEVKWLWMLLVSILIIDILRNYFDILNRFAQIIFPVRWMVYFVMVIVFLIFGQYGGEFDVNDFIYRWF